MFTEAEAKIVLSKVNPKAEGSWQYVTPKSDCSSERYTTIYELDDDEVFADCPERSLIVYHLLRMVRDLYINSKDGGHVGAYRRQCRSKRKSAMMSILNLSDEPFTFRWSCKVLGFDPKKFRNRVLFDVDDVTGLVRDGVHEYETSREEGRCEQIDAEVWLWADAPLRYQLSEKKAHYVVKMSKEDANDWIESLQGSPLEFDIERFDLNTTSTILILRHR